MFDLSQVWLIIPLIIVALGSMVVLLMGTFAKVKESSLYYFTIGTLIFALFELFLRFHAPFSLAFGHSFQFDDEASLFKMAIIALVTVIVIYSRPVFQTFKTHLAEAYSLILLSCTGMILLTSAMHLVTIFLGIELMSLPLYALVALYRDNKESTEAALKYFVMGALSSGLLLFGFAWLYGATGVLDLTMLPDAISNANKVWLLIAEVLMIAGIAFKFGVAPFHMWVPDVYEAAPTSITALIATAPKVAMTALLIHLFQALGSDFTHWGPMMTLLAIVSMLLGNVVALVQENVKRMLAYSSIGHMGIIMIAIASNSHAAISATMMYIFTYCFATLLIFAVLIQLKVNYQEIAKIKDMSGLARNYPIQAFAVLCAMFSMAGVPPLVGFMAKFMVLDVLISVKSYIWALILIASSVIGAFYYIKVIKSMYFNNSKGTAVLLTSKISGSVVVLNTAVVIALGMYPLALFIPISNSIS